MEDVKSKRKNKNKNRKKKRKDAAGSNARDDDEAFLDDIIQ